MKLKLMVGLACALFAGTVMSPVMAQSRNTPGIDRSQQEIRTRIQQGLAAGKITPDEARSFYQRERELQILESRFKADGFADPQERNQLRHDLDSLRDRVERTIATSRVARQSSYTPEIDRSQQEISTRIQQGLAAGKITPSEAQSLYQRERELQILENRFKADGSADPQERNQLGHDLDSLRDRVERIIASPRNVVRRDEPVMGDRESSISDRIEEGVRTGRITEGEARRLHRRERGIERHEARFRSDGELSSYERRHIGNEVMTLRDDVEEMMDDDADEAADHHRERQDR